MATTGMEWLKAVEERKARIAKVNAKRGGRTQYTVDKWGTVSRGTEGRPADPNKRFASPPPKKMGEAIGESSPTTKEKTIQKPQAPDFKTKQDKWDWLNSAPQRNQAEHDLWKSVLDGMSRDEQKEYFDWRKKTETKKRRSKAGQKAAKTRKTRQEATTQRLTELNATTEGKALLDAESAFAKTINGSMILDGKGFDNASKAKAIANVNFLTRKAFDSPSTAQKDYDDKQPSDLDVESGTGMMKGWRIKGFDKYLDVPIDRRASVFYENDVTGIPWSVTWVDGKQRIIAGAEIQENSWEKDRWIKLHDTEGGNLRLHFPKGDRQRSKRARNLVKEIAQGKSRSMSMEEMKALIVDGEDGLKAVQANHQKIKEDSEQKTREWDVFLKSKNITREAFKNLDPAIQTARFQMFQKGDWKKSLPPELASELNPTPIADASDPTTKTPSKGKGKAPSTEKARQEKNDAAIAPLEELAKLRTDGGSDETGDQGKKNGLTTAQPPTKKIPDSPASKKEVFANTSGNLSSTSYDIHRERLNNIPRGGEFGPKSDFFEHDYGMTMDIPLGKINVNKTAKTRASTRLVNKLADELRSGEHRNFMPVILIESSKKDGSYDVVGNRGIAEALLQSGKDFAWSMVVTPDMLNQVQAEKQLVTIDSQETTANTSKNPNSASYDIHSERLNNIPRGGEFGPKSDFFEHDYGMAMDIPLGKINVNKTTKTSASTRLVNKLTDELRSGEHRNFMPVILIESSKKDGSYDVVGNKGIAEALLQSGKDFAWSMVVAPDMLPQLKLEVKSIAAGTRENTPKDFSEPHTQIKPHRQRLAKMRELSRQYRG